MQQAFKALITFLLITTLVLTGFSAPASASPITLPSLSALERITTIAKPGAAKKVGGTILRVTPKVAKILTKKYGRNIIKIVPIAGSTLTAIELAYDVGSEIYEAIQADMARESA